MKLFIEKEIERLEEMQEHQKLKNSDKNKLAEFKYLLKLHNHRKNLSKLNKIPKLDFKIFW